jgi:rSAM/selenodomain-associated transferase 1
MTLPDRSCRLIVFARAPVPGAAKTRLMPALGAEGAARLHARLVTRTVAAACAAARGRVELWCAPDALHPFFSECAREFGAALFAQRGADLGERMYNAMRADAAATSEAPSILVGSDVPGLSPDYLRVAIAALQRHQVVLGPAEDGGYVLVGSQRPEPRLFDRIAWGGPGVLAVTRERIATLGLSSFDLPVLWDLDRPEDLDRLDPGLLDDIRPSRRQGELAPRGRRR